MVTTNEKKERKKESTLWWLVGWLVGLIENLGRASQKERKKERKKNLLAETYMQYTRFITTKKVRGQQQNLADNLLDDD